LSLLNVILLLQANDLSLIDRVSVLLGISSSPSTSFSDEPAVDPSVTTSHLCAHALNALSVFETWCKSASSPAADDASVLTALQALLSLLPSLTRLRLLPSSSLPPSGSSKVDKSLERVRYTLAKYLKRGGRVEALLVLPGAKAREVGEVEGKAREVLDRLAAHAARVLAEPRTEGEEEEGEKKARRDLATTAVDSLLLLSYSSMVIDDRSTHSPSFAYLERCLPLIGFSFPPDSSSSSSPNPEVDLTLHYSLRTLSSAYYNLGGTLFNAQQPDGAVRFCRQACEVSSAALRTARAEGGEREDELVGKLAGLNLEEGGEKDMKEKKEQQEAVRDLERLMARRWELLGLASHAVGDKKVRLYPFFLSVYSLNSLTDFALVVFDPAGRLRSVHFLRSLPTSFGPFHPRDRRFPSFPLRSHCHPLSAVQAHSAIDSIRRVRPPSPTLLGPPHLLHNLFHPLARSPRPPPRTPTSLPRRRR
jgi:separase